MQEQFIYNILRDRLIDGEKVVIYGAGRMGREIANWLLESKKNDVIAFADKDYHTKHSFFKNIPIIAPAALNQYNDCKIVIALKDKEESEKVKKTMLELGIEDERILYGETQWFFENDEVCELVSVSQKLFRKSKRNIFMFMLPEHGNTGDYLIGYAEKLFFEKYFPSYEYYGVTTLEWLRLKTFFRYLITPKDIICINGGGYLGDLRGDNIVYKDIVGAFPNNTIIFMPNTLTYREEPKDDNLIFCRDMEWVNRQKNIHLFLRDRLSYERAHRFVENSYLGPDMALFWREAKRRNKKNGKVLLCFRDDCEMLFDAKDIVKEELEIMKRDYDCLDIFFDEYISQEDGKELIQYIFDRFSEYDCVITDRLHAMVMSTIVSVPCLAFDNITKKISGVYEWIKDLKTVRLISAENLPQIGIYIEEATMIDKRGGYVPNSEVFDILASNISGIVNDERGKL